MAASPVPNQPFRPKGRELVEHFLVPKALDGYVITGLVAEGVDVFSATPESPTRSSSAATTGGTTGRCGGTLLRRPAHPAAERAPAPGGCWFPYGREKAYSGENGVGEAVAFRRRLRYHVMSQGGGDGSGVWAPTPWLMTEFRLNKGAAAFRCPLPIPNVNMDCVVRKVFTKRAVPPPPARSRDDESTGSFEGGEAFQQGGSSLPPRSARPPRPPKVVATPVAPPPHAQVIAMPMAPPPPPACSSQNEATSSRAQPDSPNANMEPVVRRVPAKPVILPTPPAQSAGAHLGWRLNKVPSGAMIITQYLAPKAFLGHLVRSVTPNFVAEEVDVFAVSPDALPFPPSRREQNGEVWGYFFAAKPTSSMRLAHGGCWKKYGREKKYPIKNGEVFAFHRRFAFHAARVDGDGMVAWEQTRWLMKEYRVNKATPSVRKAKKGPGANMDLVVLKVFTEPMVRPPPPPPPAWFSVNGGAGRSIAGGPSATAAATVAACLSP
ncbi:hypothetical protein ACQ4PT_031339 [Festuca glaucescens]